MSYSDRQFRGIRQLNFYMWSGRNKNVIYLNDIILMAFEMTSVVECTY